LIRDDLPHLNTGILRNLPLALRARRTIARQPSCHHQMTLSRDSMALKSVRPARDHTFPIRLPLWRSADINRIFFSFNSVSVAAPTLITQHPTQISKSLLQFFFFNSDLRY
jgi:hypothetical protein